MERFVLPPKKWARLRERLIEIGTTFRKKEGARDFPRSSSVRR
jgi:hypothetical protein